MITKVISVELSCGLPQISGWLGYDQVLLVFRWRGRVLGHARAKLNNGSLSSGEVWRLAYQSTGDRLAKAFLGEWLDDGPAPEPLPAPAASIVVCTRNRTADLRNCLDSLAGAARRNEIVVVDNAPADGSTEELCREYPVRYIREPRPGLNRARARGAKAACHDIVLFTDDDVVVDSCWAESMATAFADPQGRCGYRTGVTAGA